MAKKVAPVLPAFEVPAGGQWAVFCPACRCWHFHSAEPGHRAAHCITKPGMGKGYILEYAGKLTKEIRRNGGNHG